MRILLRLGHLDEQENKHVLSLTNNDTYQADHILKNSPVCSFCLKVLHGFNCSKLLCNHIYHEDCLLK